jgi:hypothetical protein
MVARLGEERAKHFAHQDNHMACLEEPYLMSLAPKVLQQGFLTAKSEQKPYLLHISIAATCTRPTKLGMSSCQRIVTHPIDLTQYYSTCTESGFLNEERSHRLSLHFWVRRSVRPILPTTGKHLAINLDAEDWARQLASGIPADDRVRISGFDLERLRQNFPGSVCATPCPRQAQAWTISAAGVVNIHAGPLSSVLDAVGEQRVLDVREANPVPAEPHRQALMLQALADGLQPKDCQVCSRRAAQGAVICCGAGHTPPSSQAAGTCPDFVPHADLYELEERSAILAAAVEYAQRAEGKAPIASEPLALDASALAFDGMSLQESLLAAAAYSVSDLANLADRQQIIIARCWGYLALIQGDLPTQLERHYLEGAEISAQEFGGDGPV